MARTLRIATTGFGSPTGRTCATNVEAAVGYLHAAGGLRADLLCLPEVFTDTGLGRQGVRNAESVPGPTTDTLAALCVAHGFHLVAGLLERRGNEVFNVALVFDDSGHIVGQYDKAHPTDYEVADGIIAGDGATVVETDLGRIGLSICYDLGYPDLFAQTKALEPDLVAWISAYDGDFQLRHYAWLHQVPFVSAVRTPHGRIIDRGGMVRACSTRYLGLAWADLDLDSQLLHADYNRTKFMSIWAKYGDRVHIQSADEEGFYVLESRDPTLSVDALFEEFELEGFFEYHNRAASIQVESRLNRSSKVARIPAE